MGQLEEARTTGTGGTHRGTNTRAERSALTLMVLWMGLLGLTVNVGGELSGADLLAVLIACAVLVTALNRPIRVVRGTNAMVLAIAVWLLAQFASNLVNETGFIDSVRGLSNIIVFLCALVGFGLLVRFVRPTRAITVVAPAAALGLLIADPSGDFAKLWKFSLSFPVLLTVAALVERSRPRTGLVLIVGSAGTMLSLLLNARSSAATFLAAVAIVFISRGIDRRRLSTWVTATSVTVVVSLGALAVAIAYPALAQEGFFGEEAARKVQIQSQGEFGLLVGGRPTTLIAYEAISDSPWVGHGSWATNERIVNSGIDRAVELGYIRFRPAGADRRIPSHSYILGAWTDSGVAGALVWVALGVVLARRFLGALGRRNMLFWEAFCYTAFAWDFFFSPFGGSGRVLTAFLMAFVLHQGDAAHRHPANWSGCV